MTVDGPADVRIAEIAGRQAGQVSRVQLMVAGVSPEQVRLRLARRILTQVHRGVYRFGGAGGSHAEEIAALLTRPCGALVCGARAAGMYRFRAVTAGVDLLVSTDAGGGGRDGVRVHRTRYGRLLEPRWIDGVPVVAPEVALLQIAADIGARVLEIAVDEALSSGRVNLDDLRAVARGCPNHPGARALAAQLTQRAVGNPTGSPGQEDLLALVRRAGLPDPHMDHSIGGGFTADLYWPDVRVALEYDTYRYHSSPSRWRRDRRKEAYCAGHDIVLIRADDGDLAEHAIAPIARVAAAIGARATRPEAAARRDAG